MEVPVAVAFIVAFTVLAQLVGFGAVRAFGIPQRSPLETCCFALALGLAIIACWMFIDGILGLDAPWTGGALLAIALGRYGWDGARRDMSALARSTLSLRGTQLTLALLLLPLPALAFVTALAPPVANDADSLTYHLAIPKLYLAHHRILYVPWSDHSNFPFTMEMLYMIGLRLSPVAAKLPHFVTFVLALATIVLAGKTFFSLEAGLAGALVFATVPMVLHQATTAYVDIALAAFTLLAFYCLIQWLTPFATRPKGPGGNTQHESPVANHHYLPLCGAFCGLAMSVKYTGVLVLAICAGWAVLAVVRSQRNTNPQIKTPNSLLVPLMLSLAIASPWYVKNIINTGNPLYPFFYEVFGGRNWSRDNAEQYTAHQREFGYERTPLNLLKSPWRASMWPWNWVPPDQRPAGYVRWCFDTQPLPPTMSMIGPTLLALILPAFLLRRREEIGPAAIEERARKDLSPPRFISMPSLQTRDKTLIVLIGSSAAFFLVWFFMEQYNRYLFPCVGLLSVIAGFGAAEMMLRNSLTRIIALTSLLVSMGIAGGLLVRFHTRATIRYTFGELSQRDYLYRSLEHYAACELINQDSRPDAKVLLLGEERGFYLDREYMWGNPGHHTLLRYKQLKTAADWCRAAKALKVTHLLVNRKFIGAGDSEWIDDGVRAGLLIEKFNAGIAVYELGQRTPGAD